MGLGSGIRNPGSGENLFRIPDPGVKKAPDPGSRIWIRNTANMQLIIFIYLFIFKYQHRLRIYGKRTDPDPVGSRTPLPAHTSYVSLYLFCRLLTAFKKKDQIPCLSDEKFYSVVKNSIINIWFLYLSFFFFSVTFSFTTSNGANGARSSPQAAHHQGVLTRSAFPPAA
jgi:hypothetical protein